MLRLIALTGFALVARVDGVVPGSTYHCRYMEPNHELCDTDEDEDEVDPLESITKSITRRLDTGEAVSVTCEATMEIVRDRTNPKRVINTPGETNRDRVTQAANIVINECRKQSKGDKRYLAQCVFYMRQALNADPVILEDVWLHAYGNPAERQRGCGRVVTMVNDLMRRRMDIDMVEMEDGTAFLEIDTKRRRLAAAAGVAAAGASGTILGYLCSSFDPVTFDVIDM